MKTFIIIKHSAIESVNTWTKWFINESIRWTIFAAWNIYLCKYIDTWTRIWTTKKAILHCPQNEMRKLVNRFRYSDGTIEKQNRKFCSAPNRKNKAIRFRGQPTGMQFWFLVLFRHIPFHSCYKFKSISLRLNSIVGYLFHFFWEYFFSVYFVLCLFVFHVLTRLAWISCRKSFKTNRIKSRIYLFIINIYFSSNLFRPFR